MKMILHTLLLSAAMILSANCHAQTKTDLSLLRQVSKMQKNAAQRAKSASGTTPEQFIRVSAVLAEGEEIPTARLEAMGIEVSYKTYRNVGLIVPVSAVKDLDSIQEFSSFSASRKFRLDNQTARTAMNVDSAQNAAKAQRAGLPGTYTGEGVVIGVFDSGIDYNHANFRDPSTNKTRIKEAIAFRKYSIDDDGYRVNEKGQRIRYISDIMEKYTDPADIDTLTSDVTDQTHGTHTSSTAAGSYTGNYKDVDGNITYHGNYQGIAPKADLILAGVKHLYDDFQYTSLTEMDKYATANNKPLVVNLSLGAIDGWFDGKDACSKFYDDFTGKGDKPGRVICVSAGNQADCNYTIYKNLSSANDHTLRTVVNCLESDDTKHPYYVETYMNIFSDSKTDTLTINTYTYSPKEKKLSKYMTHKELVAEECLFTGFDDAHDHRYKAELDFSYDFTDSLQLVIEVQSKADCKIRMINMDYSTTEQELIGGDLTYTDSEGKECTLVTTPGDNTSSINSSDCTNSIISVGAWRENLKWKLYSYKGEGGVSINLSSFYEVGEICDFSSFCLSDDNGYARPEVAAPGCYILSGFNNYDTKFFQADGTPNESGSYVSGVATKEYGRKDGRHSALGAMQGTSMSCPAVTGVVALWLQANPELTQNNIKEVIANTCDNDEFTEAHPEQFGYGKINALNGLRYILEHFPTAIHEVVDGHPKGLDESGTMKVIRNGKLIITKGGKDYSVSGQQLN